MSLYVLRHKKTGQVYSLDKPMVIGRDKADLKFLSDDKLSRNHCKVFCDRLGFACVEDLGATNKTWVNEKALDAGSEVKLKVGDVLRVGHQEFELQESTPSSAGKNLGQPDKKQKASEPTLQAPRKSTAQTKTSRIDLSKAPKAKQIVLWAILILIVFLFVLMFLYPEDAAYLIQSLGS